MSASLSNPVHRLELWYLPQATFNNSVWSNNKTPPRISKFRGIENLFHEGRKIEKERFIKMTETRMVTFQKNYDVNKTPGEILNKRLTRNHAPYLRF